MNCKIKDKGLFLRFQSLWGVMLAIGLFFSAYNNLWAACAPGGPCPNSPALASDNVGGGAGSSSYTGSVLTVNGSGAGSYQNGGTNDVMHWADLVISNACGDYTVIAQVVSTTNTGADAWVGIDLRGTNSGGADKHVFFGYNPSTGQLGVFRRAGGGGANTFVAGPAVSAPPNLWLQVQSVGGTAFFYYSTDGSTWSANGSAGAFGGQDNVGFVSASGNGSTNISTFDNVCIGPPVVPTATMTPTPCPVNPCITSATLDIYADDQADVWLNGVYFVSTGDSAYTAGMGLTGLNVPTCLLQTGSNVIAVRMKDNHAGHYGVSYKLTVNLPSGPPLEVASDPAGLYTIKYYFAGTPAGGACPPYVPPPGTWNQPGFDDSSWTVPVDRTNAGGNGTIFYIAGPAVPWVAADPLGNSICINDEYDFLEQFNIPVCGPSPTVTETGTTTATGTQTLTATETQTPSLTATPSVTGSQTNTGTVTQTGTITATQTETLTSSSTLTPSLTLTSSFTLTPSLTATDTATFTQTRTQTQTLTVPAAATATPTPVIGPLLVNDLVSFPNPATTADRVVFYYWLTTGDAEFVTIRIYTTAMRLVNILQNQPTNYGANYTQPWLLHDMSGHLLADGLYYYRLDAARRTDHITRIGKLFILH